jgi:hypothetical protein
MVESPRSTNHLDKYPHRQYLMDKLDPELRPILHFIRYQNRTLRSPGFMDQRSIVLYHNRRGLTAQVIRNDLVATLGAEAMAYSTVTDYPRVTRIIPCDATPLSATISPHINESDDAILRTFTELPFSEIRRFARATHIPVTTAYTPLSAKLRFTRRHL